MLRSRSFCPPYNHQLGRDLDYHKISGPCADARPKPACRLADQSFKVPLRHHHRHPNGAGDLGNLPVCIRALSGVFIGEGLSWTESGAEYAKRTVDHYEAAMFTKEHLPGSAKLLFIGESRPFHFDRTALAPYPYQEHPLTQWIRESASPEDLRDRLRREGFTHVILNVREFKRLHDSYQALAFSGPRASLYDQRLKQLPGTMTTVFSKNTVYVFEIPSSP